MISFCSDRRGNDCTKRKESVNIHARFNKFFTASRTDAFSHPQWTVISFGIFAIFNSAQCIMVLMGVELVLNAANKFRRILSRYVTTSLDGHVVAIFVIILAAAEAAIALAII